MTISCSRRALLAAPAFIMTAANPWPARADTLRLASYHNQPPFMLSQDTGLTFDLARYLATRLDQPVHAEVLPRTRLDHELQAGKPSLMVPWVSPTWFSEDLMSDVTLSPPLMRDKNIVISRAEKPIEYDGPESLVGYHLGIVTGRVQRDIDKLIQMGKIKATSARTPDLTLQMLERSRVDFVIMANATWRVSVPGARRHLFHVAAQPQESFTRHIMIPKSDGLLAEKITRIVTPLQNDSDWRKVLRAYDLDGPQFTPVPA